MHTSNGGLVTYVANSVTVLNCLTYNTYKTWEGLCLEIVDDSKKHIKFFNIYRPPKNNNNHSTIDSFLN